MISSGGPVDTVILAIPEGIDDIRIETVSGDISAEDIKSQLLSLTTISGDCRVRRVSNEGTFITTKSGDISIHHTETNHCELKSLSGDMGCKDVSTKKLSAHNISGDVSCSHLVLNNGLIKTISGEISVKLEPGQKPCSTFATSVSGSIHIRDGERTAADEFQRIPDGDRVKITLNSIKRRYFLKTGKGEKIREGPVNQCHQTLPFISRHPAPEAAASSDHSPAHIPGQSQKGRWDRRAPR